MWELKSGRWHFLKEVKGWLWPLRMDLGYGVSKRRNYECWRHLMGWTVGGAWMTVQPIPRVGSGLADCSRLMRACLERFIGLRPMVWRPPRSLTTSAAPTDFFGALITSSCKWASNLIYEHASVNCVRVWLQESRLAVWNNYVPVMSLSSPFES